MESRTEPYGTTSVHIHLREMLMISILNRYGDCHVGAPLV